MGYQLVRAEARNVFPLFFAGRLIKPTRVPYPCEECILEIEKWNFLVEKTKTIVFLVDLSFDFHAMEKSNEHQSKPDLKANMLYTFSSTTTSGPTLC